MSIYDNLQKDLNDKGGIKRFNLVVAFDHMTASGEGIYTANLFKITDDLELIECTNILKQHGLAKLNNKGTKWVMTTSQVDSTDFYAKDLKIVRQ